jgi:hypothetical protein
MSRLRTSSMTDDTAQLEEELRRLYAAVEAPPPPKQWPSPPARIPARPRIASAGWRPRQRRVGLVAVPLVVALVVVVLVNRSPFAPQPVLAVQLQPAGASLACKLPISALSEDHTTGFIVMDNGRATFQQVQTKGTTYIPALGVWADVLPQNVAPDGRAYFSQSYSYTTPGHLTIWITDTRGTRKLLDTAQPNLIQPFAYTASGSILVEDFSRPAGSAPGPLPYWNLKLLDPATGALRSLPFIVPALGPGNSEAGYNRNSNAIWYMAFAANGSTTVSRFDLATGRMTEWFNSTDAMGTAQFVGTDSQGSPIIQVAERDIWHTNPAQRSGIGIETLLLTSPHHISVLNHGRSGDPWVANAFSPLSATRGNEVWLASDDGAIWLYRTGVGIQQIAKVTTSNQGAPGVAISGPCM